MAESAHFAPSIILARRQTAAQPVILEQPAVVMGNARFVEVFLWGALVTLVGRTTTVASARQGTFLLAFVTPSAMQPQCATRLVLARTLVTVSVLRAELAKTAACVQRVGFLPVYAAGNVTKTYVSLHRNVTGKVIASAPLVVMDRLALVCVRVASLAPLAVTMAEKGRVDATARLAMATVSVMRQLNIALVHGVLVMVLVASQLACKQGKLRVNGVQDGERLLIAFSVKELHPKIPSSALHHPARVYRPLHQSRTSMK